MNKKFFSVFLIAILLFSALFTLTGCNFNFLNPKDKVSGHSFVTDDKFESLLELKNDGSFKFYKSKSDLTDNYYEGTYELYCGDEAIEYIDTKLSQYALTRKEQEDLMARNQQYSEDNYYCLVLVNEKCMVGGKNTLSSEIITPYYGFYIKNKLGLVNMRTATIFEFVRED